MATGLKGFVFFAYPVHVALLHFSKEYKKSLIQSRHCLVVLLLLETERSGGMREVDIGGPRESLCAYSTS